MQRSIANASSGDEMRRNSPQLTRNGAPEASLRHPQHKSSANYSGETIEIKWVDGAEGDGSETYQNYRNQRASLHLKRPRMPAKNKTARYNDAQSEDAKGKKRLAGLEMQVVVAVPSKPPLNRDPLMPIPPLSSTGTRSPSHSRLAVPRSSDTPSVLLPHDCRGLH